MSKNKMKYVNIENEQDVSPNDEISNPNETLRNTDLDDINKLGQIMGNDKVKSQDESIQIDEVESPTKSLNNETGLKTK